MVVLGTASRYTLPVEVATGEGSFVADVGSIRVAAVAVVPLIVLIVLFQRSFPDGTRAGALTGYSDSRSQPRDRGVPRSSP